MPSLSFVTFRPFIPVAIRGTLVLGAIAAHSASAASVPPPPGAPDKNVDPPPLRLEEMVVTSSPLERTAQDISVPVTVLDASELFRRRAATLGDMLRGLPGVDATSFSPGASRPVIRGLGGDRIRVLSGGLGTMDASIVSPDHAVTVEPLLVERTEIVRGPAALLYGGGAVGGIVNVSTNRIQSELPSAPLSGRLETRGGSAAHERAGAAVLTGAAGSSFAWRVDGYRRRSDDVAIPGLAPTPAVAAAMLAIGETPARGTLPNSAVSSDGASASVSYVGASGHLGLSYEAFDSFYGLVVEPDVRVDVRQRRWDLEGEWHETGGPWRAARMAVGLADYHHVELEDADIGTRFTSRVFEGRLELLHQRVGPLQGALGFQAAENRLQAEGDEAFLPPNRTRSAAVFVYEEIVSGNWTFELGARLDQQRVSAEPANGASSRRHSGTTFTGGIMWKPAAGDVIALSASRNGRAPNAQELFAEGPHAGTGAYERGDPELRSEKSFGVDLSYRRTRGAFTGAAAVFLHRFNGYIFEEATGEQEDDLPVYHFVQRNAEFTGAEGELIWHVRAPPDDRLDLRVFVDTVRATNTTARTPLPRITPVRFGAGVEWQRATWTVAAEWRRIETQDRTAPGETATDGHDLVSLDVSRRIQFLDADVELFGRVSNLFDVTARAHASFVKDITPLPGRDITVGLRLQF